MSEEVTIYHNPRCSKSRQTLAIIEDRGIKPEVVLYMDTPPKPAELKKLLSALGMSPRQLLRKGESEYKELELNDPAVSDAAILKAMSQHPRLIERPIVLKGEKAVLGRPPENVKALL